MTVGVVATWVTSQLVFSGLISGLLFGLLAMGIVLIYRATRVINFAVGNMGLVGAGLLGLLAVEYGVPFWLAALAALVLGTLFGAVMELIVIRRLFTAPRVIVLVATIGIAGLAVAIVSAYPEITDFSAPYPVPSTTTWDDVGGVRVTSAQVAVLIVVPIVAIALGWFLNRTLIGRTVKASAENPDLARVQGINPKIVSTAVWAIAGFISTLTMILIAGDNAGTAHDVLLLGPNTLVRALAAAVIAGMVSFPRAMTAGVLIGVIQALINFNYLDKPGLIDGLLFIAVLIAVALQSRSRAPAETQTFSFAPKIREVPDHIRGVWWVKRFNALTLVGLLILAILLPLVITTPSRHLLYATIACFAICGLSLTVLTGWAGQLSLGQMAFAGFGALVAAALTRGLHFDLGVITLDFAALPFLLSILIASFATAVLAALIGIGALRVRGLLLAVSTFAFAVAAQQYLFRQPVLSDNLSSVPFNRGTLFGLDLEPQRTYYYVCLAALVVALALVSRLRTSGIGRTTIAVRDNADSAAAYTVGVASSKLRAFALAGFLAGLGGAFLAGAVETVPYTERYFLVADSLSLVALVVIGGIGSPIGAVLGALWVVGLPAFFPDNNLVPLFTSSVGLLLLLLYFPGGLAQIAYSIRDGLFGWAARRVEAPPTTRSVATPPVLQRPVRAPLDDGVAALDVSGVSVRFGGIVAVDDVSLRIESDEIVGLIGTNGAGKSTLMNAIGGFVPAVCDVSLHGQELSAMGPARRARAGLGRTFQAARLFPELTVRETVQVALEARGKTGFVSTALCLPRSVGKERQRKSEADDLISFLGLGRYANSRISDLSTGTRRIVELAGLLALDARVLCLDEPTAGVAQRETEAFGPLIKEIRRELGAAMLVIEHDMPLIMSISDRVYCLETGRVIAEGAPDVVRNDARVISSYLGVDERAIARSGAAVKPIPNPSSTTAH
jgi:ABC-type branched-subunit amino acid transport system ATPase component/ABC-type branched-subunit amino acid transport system permease subunit